MQLTYNTIHNTVTPPSTLLQADAIDRHLMGSFVAGDDVDLATPAVLYELGCPGCDLSITAEVGGYEGGCQCVCVCVCVCVCKRETV